MCVLGYINRVKNTLDRSLFCFEGFFRQVEQEDGGDWVSASRDTTVAGEEGRGRKTWKKCIADDTRKVKWKMCVWRNGILKTRGSTETLTFERR